MFWLFRRRKPLTTSQILDSAAGIMFARGKAAGRSEDAWGRVDVLGAIKIVIFGTSKPDSSKIRNFGERWERYGDAKLILASCLCYAIGEKLPGPTSISMFLAEWSDRETEQDIVAWLRRAAREARHMEKISA